MKYLKPFNTFSLNESKINIGPSQIETILNAMKNYPGSAASIYSTFRKGFPEIFKQLEEGAIGQGTSLNAILDSHFQKDPTMLHILDAHPDIKAEVLQRTKMEDFSRLGRLSKMDLF